MLTRKLFGVTFAKNITQFMPIILKQYKEAGGNNLSGLEELFGEKDCKHYYVTKSVIDTCTRIKVREPFDLEWLRPKLENGIKQWSFDDKLFRFVKNEQKIVVIYATEAEIPEIYKQRAEEKGVDYAVFDFDLVNKTEEVIEGNQRRPVKKDTRLLFFQLLCYIVLAEIEITIVPPGKKHGPKNAKDHVFNEERFPMAIINSNWNRTSMRSEGFWVDGEGGEGGEDGKGFYRLQACGPGWSERELKLIKPFKKHGYTRKAGKLKD